MILFVFRVVLFILPLALSSDLYSQVQNNGTILGRISDQENHSVRANVIVYDRSIIDGRKTLIARGSAKTDDEGRYECHNLPAGDYVVSVQVHSQANDLTEKQPVSDEKVYPRVFFPSATNLGGAELVLLNKSQTAVADVVVIPSPSLTLLGELQGHPQSASFRLLSDGGGYDLPIEAPVTYDPLSGSFSITHVPSGKYKITADWSTGGQAHHGEGDVFVDAAASSRAHIAEIKRHTLKGTLHIAADEVFGKKVFPKTIVLEGTGDQAGWQLSATVSDDGTFVFPPIIDGEYVLHTLNSQSLYVAGITMGRSRTNGERFRLSGDNPTVVLGVDLSSTQASLDGSLDLEKIIPRKTAIALRSLVSGRLLIVRPDVNGRFEFATVPPGEYSMYAWIDLDKIEYRNPDVLAAYKRDSIDILLDNTTHLTDVKPSLVN